jgi:hypothetical protein
MQFTRAELFEINCGAVEMKGLLKGLLKTRDIIAERRSF